MNQMSASNLGIVFGPTLLRPSEGVATFDSLLDTPYQTRIVELLILNVDSIFGEEETFCEHGEDEDTGPEKGAVKEEALVSPTSPSDARWFDMPERTENLMDELARDPLVSHLMRSDDFLVLPGATTNTSLASGADIADPAPASGSTPGGSLADVDDDNDDEDESDLPDTLLPDSSSATSPVTSCYQSASACNHPPASFSTISASSSTITSPLPSTPVSCLPPSIIVHSLECVPVSQASAELTPADDGSVKTSSPSEPLPRSPGLRKKLLPSQVISRPVSKNPAPATSNSIFYTSYTESTEPSLPVNTLPLLNKPSSYNPTPTNSVNMSMVCLPLTKSHSTGALTPKSSSASELMYGTKSVSNSTFYINPSDDVDTGEKLDAKEQVADEPSSTTTTDEDVKRGSSRQPEYV